MITGFNTDVHYDGCVYHVQTEDRGRDHPILESLVYVGGTIIAKKLTPYDEQLKQGVSEDIIAGLLRRQHQVMIAAIKAGRVDELVRHSEKEQIVEPAKPRVIEPEKARVVEPAPVVSAPPPPPEPLPETIGRVEAALDSLEPEHVVEVREAPLPGGARAAAGNSGLAQDAGRIGLNLDQVISDYLKRSAEQGRLDLRVLSPNVFTAGKTVGLKVEILRNDSPEAEAIVTVKIIGTAFKPQVHIARADRNGVAVFNLSLPSFTAGTAAIVIEAQSNRGRGELKHLIRRA
jgi:hypothetical protein